MMQAIVADGKAVGLEEGRHPTLKIVPPVCARSSHALRVRGDVVVLVL